MNSPMTTRILAITNGPNLVTDIQEFFKGRQDVTVMGKESVPNTVQPGDPNWPDVILMTYDEVPEHREALIRMVLVDPTRLLIVIVVPTDDSDPGNDSEEGRIIDMFPPPACQNLTFVELWNSGRFIPNLPKVLERFRASDRPICSDTLCPKLS